MFSSTMYSYSAELFNLLNAEMKRGNESLNSSFEQSSFSSTKAGEFFEAKIDHFFQVFLQRIFCKKNNAVESDNLLKSEVGSKFFFR